MWGSVGTVSRFDLLLGGGSRYFLCTLKLINNKESPFSISTANIDLELVLVCLILDFIHVFNHCYLEPVL